MKIAVTLELKGSCWVPGLRPYLWNIVKETNLGGWVSNTVDGVQLMLKGDDLDITLFLRGLPDKLARKFQIHTLQLLKRVRLPEDTPQEPFRLAGPVCYDGVIEGDRAPCPECREKMLDANSPYYRYPFLNCPECGPGYSVTLMAGGKRENTTFRSFPPCEKCVPHLEKNPIQTCPACGPSVFLIRGDGEAVFAEDPLAYAGQMIAEGNIVAVKNFDGFVLVCDPFHLEAVQRLRERRNQTRKPISIYANDISVLRENCECSREEENLLRYPSAPVVPLALKPESLLDGELFCPDHPGTIGAAFPPTGMIHILLESCPDGFGGFCSFGMLAFSGGPLPVDPADAGGDDDLAEVSEIADLIVMHDLKIWHAGGPSVQSVIPGTGVRTSRRCSGVTPEPLVLRKPVKRTVLALGADSCASVSLGYKNKIVPSHQMGDICSERNALSLSLAAQQLIMMFARIPDLIVCDMDPGSFSAKTGELLSGKCRIPLVTVQRHHANALACLAEHHLKQALALVWDGGAAGPDGSVWGAELLDVTYQNFNRLATFAPVPMNHPRERTLRPPFLLTRYLDQCGIPLDDELAELLEIPEKEYQEWRNSESFSDTAETHAALTLFDAVAAAIGIGVPVKHYGQQILLRMEHAVSCGYDDAEAVKLMEKFPFQVRNDDLMMIDWLPFFRQISNLKTLRSHSPGDLTAAFFHSAAEAALQMVLYGSGFTPCRDVVLSGKAFLSPTLTGFVMERLENAGFQVYCHEVSSPDESSVSIGQAIAGGMI